MKLTYIYHSGFILEAQDITIIIDYYKDPANIVMDKIKNNSGYIYVLSTHAHHDHFNSEILKWKQIRNDIKYIFSKDILETSLSIDKETVYLDRLDSYKDANIYVKAFGSTDIGVSFYLEISGEKIFHAGDFNNWHWNEESSEKEITEAENYYLKELKVLVEDISVLNLAMFPVDPRLGKDYMKGAKQFIEAISVNLFVPMHFDNEFDKANAFKSYAQDKGIRFFEITGTGQSILF
jgi:L-ascorbate metabolism protein UlaG (beta-lactamase superfamily)